MKYDKIGIKELYSLKIDWKIYQLDAASTKCCAGGTRDSTFKHGNNVPSKEKFIPCQFDSMDAQNISLIYGYLRS